MNIHISASAEQQGVDAATHAAGIMNAAIARNGRARIVLSTGASQFDFFKAFVTMDIDWSKVEAFHLDDYINMPEDHPASFKKYLKERFLNQAPVGTMHFVNGSAELQGEIARLTEEIRKEPIDLALIGIGENTHIAFNDPPADFDTTEAFKVVELDDVCRNQQFKEGWFATLNDVPSVALTMTVHEMMRSKAIISCVPYPTKADAVKRVLEAPVSNAVPASILKTHSDFSMYLDVESAARIVNMNHG